MHPRESNVLLLVKHKQLSQISGKRNEFSYPKLFRVRKF